MNLPSKSLYEQLAHEARVVQEREKAAVFLAEHGEEYIALKEAELALKRGLPHLYGYPWYEWAYDFFTSREKMNFLCAANQISKSSTQIRKCVDWATDKKKWPELWPGLQPNQFWYLYPSGNQASIEFDKKWRQFLPKEEYKNHPEYGWREEWKNKEIFAVHFNTGISVYFKTYKQGLDALQTGTVFAVFLDEECPEELWDELVLRVAAVDGYIHMVFTATIGQEIWRKTIEPKDSGEEKFPGAWKRQVSMYDCIRYLDGSPSQWTEERINKVMKTCKSTQEVQRRVFGKFVKDSGLKYPMFDVKKHMVPVSKIPDNWLWYVGCDIGSGGDDGHPSAVCIIAVAPNYQMGRVVSTWRGDGIRTTASDVYNRAEEMIRDLEISPVGKYYDWGSAEFGEISARNGGGWIPAEKKHEVGEQIINVLFRNNMLGIQEVGENGKLAGELASLTVEGVKRKKKDDLSDAFRYSVTKIPWDWSIITGAAPESPVIKPEEKLSPYQIEVMERRKAFESGKSEQERIDEEFAFWNGEYGA